MFKESLFEDDGRQAEKVPSEFGDVWVRTLTVAEKDAWELAVATAQREGKQGSFRAYLLVACCCDDSGNPVFDEFDVAKLGKLASWKVEPMIDAAIRINRIGPKDAEQIRKN